MSPGREGRQDEKGRDPHFFSPNFPVSFLFLFHPSIFSPSPRSIANSKSRLILKMNLLSVILSLLSLLPCLVASSSSSSAFSHSVDILYWPVISPQPSSFARISYDPSSLNSQVESISPPKDGVEDLARIGLYSSTGTGSKQWSGTLTSLESLSHSAIHQSTLRLHLGPSGDIYHVSLSPYSSSSNNSTNTPNVVLVPNEQGPRPQLNRPIVVGPDGKNTEEAPEKTFVQK